MEPLYGPISIYSFFGIATYVFKYILNMLGENEHLYFDVHFLDYVKL